MHKILFTLFLPFYLFSANFLDISLENKMNYQFSDHIFYDTNNSAHKQLESKESFNNININGNFNDMIGIDIDYTDLGDDKKYYTTELYIGTPSLKFFAYGEEKENMTYNISPINMGYAISNNTSINTLKNSYRYTFLSLVTVTNSDFSTENMETIATGEDDSHDELVTRQYNLETTSISSEHFYETTKEDVLKGEEYIYPIAISKNITSWLRVYGVAIVSFEKYDYSEGEVYYMKKDDNSTRTTKKNVFQADEDTGELTSANFAAIAPENGRFKGFSYGYKLTAEAHYNNYSFFITSFYKQIDLKNYSTQIGQNTYSEGTISVTDLKFRQKYTSFGLKYKF